MRDFVIGLVGASFLSTGDLDFRGGFLFGGRLKRRDRPATDVL